MSKEHQQKEQQIAGRARELFAGSVAGLDGQTRSRLSQARAAAVEAAGRKQGSWLSPSYLLPAGGVAAAVLAVAVFWNGPEAPVTTVESAALTDLDILLEGEALDLYEELEFYAWLLEEGEVPEQPAQDGSG